MVLVGSAVIGAVGYFAMSYTWLGWLLFPVGLLCSLYALLGFVCPSEIGCTVDDNEIKWWSTRPAKSERVSLKNILAAKRESLDSSWIDISTTDGTDYTIGDSYTGETDRIYRSLAHRLERMANDG